MKLILIVGLGSFLGGILRYTLSQLIQGKFVSSFPFGTLGVNLIGCLIIGLVFAFSERNLISTDWKLFLATGICGGFTTFSAFSSETFSMMRNAQYSSALIYVSTSVILGVVFTVMGYLITRIFV